MPRFHHGRKPKRHNSVDNWNNPHRLSYNPDIDKTPIYVVRLPNGATFTKCKPSNAAECTPNSDLRIRKGIDAKSGDGED
jgi:hypothetical protein